MSEVLSSVEERVATVTLDRPEARNALSIGVREGLWAAMTAADADDEVDVVILTGTDPAFCAGMDLGELAAGALTRTFGEPESDGVRTVRFFPVLSKPVIGAVNGPAVTGGLELALQCDFLVASERARFGDTHARVGVMPGGGMTALLPDSVGLRRALEMSLTGNFLDAAEALQFGLVNHVVPHAELLAFARRLALDIVGSDREAVRHILATYREVAAARGHDDALTVEASRRNTFLRDADEIGRRRQAVIERGRRQS